MYLLSKLNWLNLDALEKLESRRIKNYILHQDLKAIQNKGKQKIFT
jgi:hypothetical protein